MTISSNGIIAYGIMFDEDNIENLPWIGEDGDGDIDDWWVDVVHKWKPPFVLFDESGNYTNDVKPPQEWISEYFDKRREFVKSLPKLPIKMVIHCSFDYSMWIMAIPETVMSVSRGYPQKIPDGFVHHDPQWDKTLVEFCEQYKIEIPDQPSWWLTSLYG